MTRNMNMKTETKNARLAAMNAILIARADKFALSLQGTIDLLRDAGLTHHGMAEALNYMGLRTPRGHFWAHKSVRNVCARLDAIRKDAQDAQDALDAHVDTPCYDCWACRGCAFDGLTRTFMD
jgi:hypothetical protein